MVSALSHLAPVVALVLGAILKPAASAVLVDFQVTQPPPITVAQTKQCTQFLFDHTFGFSFGLPALAEVVPPTDCGPIGSWSGITLNFTCTSNGTQFDRLAIISFEGSELWRTSTPEPTRGDGIIWTYIKDLTKYIPLLSKPGTLQLELDNLLETTPQLLDGQYDVRLSITYYASSRLVPPAPKASTIIGVTNFTSVPGTFSTNITFPRNAVQLYAEVFASGNGNEEFWYFNTANQFVPDLPDGTTLPQGPFREVQMMIDSHLAGVVFPYPVYFTGAITPNAWRPITSYGALELPTYAIDLTPFIPILSDGQPHNVSLSVVSAEADHSINQNWFVSSLIQVVTDKSGKATTGSITVNNVLPFAQTSIAGSVGDNGDVNVTVSATRTLHIESNIISGSGSRTHVVWKQDMIYSNLQQFLQNTTVQNVIQKSSGTSLSTHNGVAVVSDRFNYPMEIDIVATPDFSNFTAHFDHSYIRQILPAPFQLATSINNHQVASGAILTLPSGNRTGNGNNTNTFFYSDATGNTYSRKVTAQLNNITEDEVSGSLARGTTPSHIFIPESQATFVARLPRGRKIPFH